MATENGSARIGKSVVIRGEVKGGEDLIIDGRVEGTVTLTESRLTIGPERKRCSRSYGARHPDPGSGAGQHCSHRSRGIACRKRRWKAMCARCGSPWKTMPFSAEKLISRRAQKRRMPSPQRMHSLGRANGRGCCTRSMTRGSQSDSPLVRQEGRRSDLWLRHQRSTDSASFGRMGGVAQTAAG